MYHIKILLILILNFWHLLKNVLKSTVKLCIQKIFKIYKLYLSGAVKNYL